MITDHDRAAHAVRARAVKLAEETVAELYRLQPDLHDRYGPDGRRHCVRDVTFHVDFLAASVDAGDPRRFAEYVAYARGLLAAHQIPPADFLASLRALRRAVARRLTSEVAAVVLPHVDAALAALRGASADEGEPVPNG